MIPAGVTVTFKNHPANPPVVWLVKNSVTINGTIKLDGQKGHDGLATFPYLSVPGPGGFSGGRGHRTNSLSASAGYGLGGGPKPANSVGTERQPTSGELWDAGISGCTSRTRFNLRQSRIFDLLVDPVGQGQSAGKIHGVGIGFIILGAGQAGVPF